MKKQRILALALAASTAASVFGGFSASAAENPKDAPEKFVAYTPVVDQDTLNFDDVENNEEEFKNLLDKIYVGSYDADLAVESGMLYLFDYSAKLTDGSYADGKFNANTADYKKGDDIKESLLDAISKGYGLTSGFDTAGDNMNLILTEFFKEFDDTASNKEINDAYKLNVATVAALQEADYSGLYYDADSDGVKDSEDSTIWEAYGLAALQAAYTDATKSISEKIYLLNAYEDIAAALNFAAPKSNEEKYNELLDKALTLTESDFTEAGWKEFSKQLGVAEAYANAGDYDQAYKTLDDAWKARKLVKPDVTELKAVLDSLYVDGKYVPASNAPYSGTDKNHVYQLANNKVNGNPSFEWNRAFNRGTYKDSYGDSYTGCYFGKASDMYYDVYRRANSGKHTQADVDAAASDLEAAVSALNEGGAGANWEVLKLEELVEKAEAVVETDYNTSRTAWKNFEKALADAQDVLAESNPTSVKLDRAYNTLETAMKNLKSAKLAPSAADKAELKALLTEAKTLLKNMDGKVLAQVTALDDAVEAGDKVYANYSSKLISEVEKAIADLESAIAGYNQKQGWYWDGKAWFYGKGATTVKGWLNDNGTWYYLDPTTGAMKTGWQKIDNVWYLFKTGTGAGKMLTGWQKDGNTWYYLNSNGSMATGWAKINNVWYYFQPSGAMVSNTWAWIGGKCYYFYASGAMAANTTIDGYKVDASGAWVK